MVSQEEIMAFRRKLATDIAAPICFRTGKPWASPFFIENYVASLSDELIANHLEHWKKHRCFGNPLI